MSCQDFCAKARGVRPRSQPVEVYDARPHESYLRAAGAAFSIFSRPLRHSFRKVLAVPPDRSPFSPLPRLSGFPFHFIKLIRTFDAFAFALAPAHDLSCESRKKDSPSLSFLLCTLLPAINAVLNLSSSPFSPLPLSSSLALSVSRHRHDQVTSYAIFHPFTLRHTGFPTRFLPLTFRLPSPEWNVLLNNRTPNGERASINPQSTIPFRDPLGGPQIHIRYASPRRSYVRAIEKTVSSLIPPTATFRLPAA